ncbi:MAG: acyl-CoA synthetase FdrA [Thermodesulfobacteriota bacterium]
MVVLNSVKQNYYQDSMQLMQISKELTSLPGIKNASAIMATGANLKMLEDAGLIKKAPANVSANDLIIAVEAESKKYATDALKKLDSFLVPLHEVADENIEYKNFDSALGALNQPNLALISVPGEFAKLEVARAINNNIHTFLFSDNLSVNEEVELKQRAIEKGLLMMGPGCGTAIINGTCLGFANIVRRGPIGVVAAAGTGLQEVTSLIHNWGLGISHGIGVGGRDLSEEVGGLMTIEAIKLLQKDKKTDIILLVSKPASVNVVEKILRTVRKGKKPFAMCLLGEKKYMDPEKNIFFSETLEELSLLAVNLAGQKKGQKVKITDYSWKIFGKEVLNSLNHSQLYVRGLFSGGTLCYEAQKILTSALGQIYSNVPLSKDFKLKDSNKSLEHSCIDLGEEELTVGRPHPMIDSTLRSERIIQEAKDPGTAIILFDVVLGYSASPDPAGDLLPAIEKAKDIAKSRNRSLAFITSVCGTEDDIQDREVQEERLRNAGVQVVSTNAQAARAAGWIASRTFKGGPG